jgi:hypothetical protein
VKLLGVDLVDVFTLADRLVHHWLGESSFMGICTLVGLASYARNDDTRLCR